MPASSLIPKPPFLPPPVQECKLAASAGFTKSLIHGGGNYTIPLKQLSFDYQP